jgi:hypothetical protein
VLSPNNRFVSDGASNTWNSHFMVSARASDRPLKRLAGVYWDEVTPSLRQVLIESDLALTTTREIHVGTAAHQPGEWLAMDPRLAWAYKCAITEHLSRINELEPLTDGISSYALTRPWTADRVVELLRDPHNVGNVAASTGGGISPTETAALVAMLALRIVVPANLDEVPAERIVAVRKGCETELDVFRSAVTAAAEDVATLALESADAAVVAAYLDQVVSRHFKRPLADLRAAMRGLGTETVLGAMALKAELPPAVATVANGLAIGQPVLTAAGVALAVLGLGRSWKSSQAAKLDESPASYLLRVEKGLRPRTLISRVSNPQRHDRRTT